MAHWLITEGLRTIPVEKLSKQVQRIKVLKKEVKDMTTDEWEKSKKLHDEAFGEGYIHPLPKKGDIGWGAGLVKDEKGQPIGLDWDKMELVTNRGKTRISLEKKKYTEKEQDIMRRTLPQLRELSKSWTKMKTGTKYEELRRVDREMIEKIEKLI